MSTVTGLMLSCLGTATLLCKHVKYVCGAGSMIVFSQCHYITSGRGSPQREALQWCTPHKPHNHTSDTGTFVSAHAQRDMTQGKNRARARNSKCCLPAKYCHQIFVTIWNRFENWKGVYHIGREHLEIHPGRSVNSSCHRRELCNPGQPNGITKSLWHTSQITHKRHMYITAVWGIATWCHTHSK